MDLEQRVTALEKENAALKLQLEERPYKNELILLEFRKKRLLEKLEITPMEQRPIVLNTIERLDRSFQLLMQACKFVPTDSSGNIYDLGTEGGVKSMKKMSGEEYKTFLGKRKKAIQEIICVLRDKNFNTAAIVSILDEVKEEAMYSSYISSESNTASSSEMP